MKMTVITVCRNAEATIGRTIESVLAQDYPDIEHIIVDGMSTDNTMAVVARYRDRIAKIIHEPDSGISDAMNKGIAAATGDWLFFLQADDYFLSDRSIGKAASELDPAFPLHAFQVLFEETDGKKKLLKPRPWGPVIRWKIPFPHQGVVSSRALFSQVGGFDTAYGMCMDYEWLFRVYKGGYQARRHQWALAVMPATGISSSRQWALQKRRFLEEHLVHMQHAPNAVCRWMYQVYWLVYLPYRRLRSVC